MLTAALRDIESPTFSARVNAASDLATFLEAISAQPSVVEVQRSVRKESGSVSRLVRKMRHLRDLDFDTRYENPMDAAMVAYGWALATERPQLVGLVSDLLRSLGNSWWAMRMATLYRSSHRETRSATVHVVLSGGEWRTGAYTEFERLPAERIETPQSAGALGLWARMPIDSLGVPNQAFHANLGIFNELDEFELWFPDVQINSRISWRYQVPDRNVEGRGEKWSAEPASTKDDTGGVYALEFAE